MRLTDFPRPPNDNRRGIHWSASPYHLMGDQLTPWLDELAAMNIKWVKLMAKGDRDLSDRSTVELCQRLLACGIFPIVRLYRPQQNPGTLNQGQQELVRELVDLGVRYFETNNEPNLPTEWQNNNLPQNWLEIATRDWIQDADFLISVGALPGTPAMSFGGGATIIREIQRQGRLDLFEKGAWIAIHNYCLNHPLDYPYDEVNLHGRPLTPEEYDALGPYTTDAGILAALKNVLEPASYAAIANPHWAWMDGYIKNTREAVNQMREQHKRPDCTLADDANCFREYELAAQTVYEILGYHVPIITTEGGVVVGDKQDGRYPRMTLDRHREYTVAMFDFMMNQAPDYYFALCPWLIANYQMGLREINWESQAWYSDWHCPGHLPTVDAVKAMPAVGGAPLPRQGVIQGTVQNGAGRRVRLIGPGGTSEQTVGSDERFRFANLVAGTYRVEVVDTYVRQENIQIDGTNTVEVRLAVTALPAPTWQGIIVQNTSSPTPVGGMSSAILCRVIGRPAVPVTIRLGTWSLTVPTGTKDPDSCEFAPLRPGEYTLTPEGLDASVQVFVDGAGSAIVEFRQADQHLSSSSLPSPSGPAKTLNHYLLLARYLPGKAILLSVGRYMARFAPAIGFDPTEAQHAHHVTILGSVSPTEDAALEMMLREAGCQVERINDNAANIVSLLNKMVAEGRRFLTM